MGCVEYLTEVYQKRHAKDTNPRAVQPLSDDKQIVMHWYYRSDKAIASSDFVWPNLGFVPGFEFEIDKMPKKLRDYFLAKPFVTDWELTFDLEEKVNNRQNRKK